MVKTNHIQAERWGIIPGFDKKYEVSTVGNVRSRVVASGGKALTLRLNNRGYRVVTLRSNGIGRPHLVHRLVAATFLTDPQPMVRHLNDIPTDNRLENLAYGTALDNAHDRIRNHPESQTHCKHGHEFTEANTRRYEYPGNKMRVCKACDKMRSAEWKRNKRALAVES